MKQNSSTRRLLVYLLMIMLASISVFGKTGTEINNELQCGSTFQPTNPISGTPDYTKLYECPALANYSASPYNLKHSLVAVDFASGDYTCEYRYGGKDLAQTCAYTSRGYRKMTSTITDTLYGTDAVHYGKFDLFQKDTLSDYKNNNGIEINTIFNKVGASDGVLSQTETSLNAVHKSLKELVLNGQDKSNRNLTNVDASLDKIRNITYKSLVLPYYDPTHLDAMKKENTFSNFLAGLITLDDRMVEGYDEATGQIKINSVWKLNATSMTTEQADLITTVKSTATRAYTYVTSWFSNEPDATEEATYKNKQATTGSGKYILNISSWVDIFELKLWGFYYNFQRRFDLGYDVMSTQLLYIMSLWFILIGGTRMGVGHLINREQGFKVSEDNWMKTLAMLVGMGVFFISMPTPNTSASTAETGAGTIKEEYRKNKTIMKFVIRESAQMGANFGTMMSDLGLDAFLSFVVKKQEVLSVKDIASAFQSGVSQASMYYPAVQIAEQCRDYFKADSGAFYSANPQATMAVDSNWENQTFAKNNNISSFSFDLCKKAHTLVGVTPYDMYLNIAETEARIKNIDEVMAKSVYQLTSNMVAVQNKMGWVNTFNVPVSYFIMKHGDMFLSNGVDYDKIVDKAKSMVKAVGVKATIKTTEMGNGNRIRELANYTSDTAQQFAGAVTSYMSHFLLYNMLPGFSGMQEGISGYLDKIYGDKLEIRTGNLASGGKAKKGFKRFVRKLKTMAKRGASKAFFPLKILMAFVPTDVTDAFAWRSLIFVVSYLVAIYAWKLTFTVMFISTIAIMLLLKTVLYFKDLMVHTIASVFIVVWAFAKQGGQGESKMVGFARDTLVLMIYPSLIVLGAYTFIFVYEMFTTVYSYLMIIMLEGQKASVGLMAVANNDTDSFTSYMNIGAIENLSAILVDVFGLFIALITIMKFPEYVLKKLGINESETMSISSTADAVSQRGEKFSNPM